MRLYALALFAFMATATLSAKEKIEIDFFARVLPDRTEIIRGDSCLISYVLYASVPFSKIESKSEVNIRGAKLRRRNIQREATAGRTIEQGKMYYTLVWAQYVVIPEESNKIVLPACKFSATFFVSKKSQDPFDEFFSNREKPEEIKSEATNAKLIINIREKPQRTQRELMNSGGTVM